MAKYKKVYKKGKAYTVTKSDGSKVTRYSPGRYVKVKVDDKKSSSGSSSKEMKTINASLSWDGNIETISETVGGKTTTTITDKRTGRSVRKSGSSSYNSLSKEEKESINPASKAVDVEALRKKLQEEQKTKGLRAKAVDIKTGRVVDQGNFKVNRDFERRLRDFERQHGRLNPAQKINIASYEQIYGKKADPKSQDVRELLKVRSISPTLQQQLNQKQTTSRELQEYVTKLNTPNAKSLALVTEGEKRFIKGEKLVNFGNGYVTVIDKNGKARALTEKELKELKENPDLVNPLRVFTGAFMGGAQLRYLVDNPDLLAKGAKEFVKAPVTSTVNMLASAGAQLNKDPFGFTGELLAFEGVGGAIAKGARGVSRTVKTSKVGAKIGETVKKVRLFEEDQLVKINSRINQLEKQGVNVKQRTLDARELKLLQEQKKIFKKFKFYTAPIDNLKSNIAKKVKQLEKTNSKPQRRKLANEIAKDIKKANELVTKRNKVKTSKKVKDHKAELAKFEKERLAQNKGSKKKLSESDKLRRDVKIVGEEMIIKTLKDNFKNPTKLKQLKKIIKEERGLNVKILQTPKGLKVILKEGGKNAKKGVKTARTDKTYLITEKGQVVRLDKQRKGKVDAPEDPLTPREKKKFEKDLEFKDGQNLDKVLNDLRRYENRRTSLLGNKKAQAQLFKSTGRSYKKIEKVTKEGVAKTKKFIDDYRKRVETANKQNKELVRKGKKSKDFSKSERERFTKQKKKLDKELKDNIKKVKAFDKSLVKLAKVVPALALASKSLQGTLSQQAKLLDKAQDVLQKQELKLDKVTPNKGSGKGFPKGGKGGKPSGGSSRTTKTTKTPTPKPKGGRGKLKTPDPKPKPKPKIKSTSDKKKVKFSKVTTKGEIIYTNEKGSKVKIKTGLPYDWAYKVALETVDESLLGSTKVRKYGKIKSRNGLRFDNALLKKFRDKKSTNPRVNEIVEKSKHRLDTKSEVSSIQAKKVLASKLKIAKETIKELKKASKKTSRSKTTKKVKKSPKTSLKSKRKGGKR